MNKNPETVELRLLLGIAYEKVNDKDDAKKEYEKIIEIDENNSAAKAALEHFVQ